MLVLNKDNIRKYKVLIEQDVKDSLNELLTEVENQHVRQIKAGLPDSDLQALAGKIELIRNLKTFEQAIRKNG